MKIAITILRHRLGGGVQGFVNRTAVRLAQRGHEVWIVCRSHQDAPHPSVRFQTLRSLALGGMWRTWAFARAVERHVAEGHYDVVLGMGRCWSQDVVRMSGGCYLTYLSKAHTHVLRPWERWIDQFSPKHRLYVAIERRILACPKQRIVTNSEMVKADLVRSYSVDPRRVSVVYNGVDTARFHPRLRDGPGLDLRREWGIPQDVPLILFLGSGYGRKGLDIVLEALGLLVRAGARAYLAVVGHDSNPSRYVNLAKRLGLRSWVHFVGHHSAPERCFAAADVYVLPSRYDAFSNSTLEALATGLPAIASRSDGASEIIRHQVNGSVLPEVVKPEGLAEELGFWIEGDRASSAREAARSTAELYTADRETEKTVAILEEAARDRAEGRRNLGS